MYLLVNLVLGALLACGKPEEIAVVQGMNCDGGDMNACYTLGKAALDQARPNIREARDKFAKGCNVHHPPSCNGLGEMVRDAKGGPRDMKRASELFGIACEGGIQSACVNLAESYYQGEGVKPDQAKAVAMFTATCDHPTEPQPRACSSLGVAYSDGLGVEKKDQVKAQELYTRSCGMNYPPACVLSGQLHQEAKGGKRAEALAAAATLFEKACTLDPHFGCMEVAAMHESGDAPEASAQKAAVFYQKTCNIDPTRGCYEAAHLMEEGKVTAREGEIESLYNLACEHGNAEACTRRSLD